MKSALLITFASFFIGYLLYRIGRIKQVIFSINEALYNKERKQTQYLSNLKRIKDDIKKTDFTHSVDSLVASQLLSGKINRNKTSKTKPAPVKTNTD